MNRTQTRESGHGEVSPPEPVESLLKKRLEFEALLSDLSARFVNVSPGEVDREIEQALKDILDLFQVDRAGLVRTLPGKDLFQITHTAYGTGVPPVPAGVELPVSIYPWSYDKLTRRGEVVAYSRLADLPPEAEVDKKTWAAWGILSNVNIPLFIGESVDHIISINAVKRERVWPEELFPRLRLLGEIFVNALERRRGQLELEDRLRFERLISDLSARFVNIAAEEILREITAWLKGICRVLPGGSDQPGVVFERRQPSPTRFGISSGRYRPGPYFPVQGSGALVPGADDSREPGSRRTGGGFA